MKEPGQARELSEVMVELGPAHGVRTTALLTQMDVPLGRTAGNALEVVEAVEVLAGGGPSDVVELTLDLAREMLDLAGLADADPAAALADGRAMDVWRRDGAGPGRRPGRAAAPRHGGRGRRRPRPPAPSPASTPWRSASRPGGSAPAEPQGGRRLPHRRRGVARHRRRPRRGRASPSSSSTSTTPTRLESRPRGPRRTPSRSPTDPVTPPPLVLGRVG